jgi:O-antigen/teichoic acid export membrane protein
MDEVDSAAATLDNATGKIVARNALYLVVGQIISSALAVILTASLGRQLGVVEFGNYYLLIALSSFAYMVVDWGHSAYLVRESARRRDDGDRLLGGALVFRLLAAVLAAAATPFLIKLIGYDVRVESLALLAVMCGLPLALAQTYAYMFRGRDRMDLDAALTIVSKAVTVAATVTALALGGDLASVLMMSAIGGFGGLLLAVYLARQIGLIPKSPGLATVRELAVGGAPIVVFFLAMAVQPFVDAIVLSKLVPPEVVGWYGAARGLMGVLLAPATILSTAAFPELSRVSASIPDLHRTLRTTLRLLLGLGALAAVGTFLFADLAVALIYGPGHFDPAAAVLRTFAPVLPLFFMDMCLGTTITAVGKTKEIALIKALSVGVSTGLALLLIPACQTTFGNGGIGLVLAFGSTEVLMLIAYLWLLPRGAIGRSALFDLVRAGVAAGGTIAIFQLLPALSPWLAVPASIVLFIGLALVCGLILRADLRLLADLVRGEWSLRRRSEIV